jgi:hypothetical protein
MPILSLEAGEAMAGRVLAAPYPDGYRSESAESARLPEPAQPPEAG